MHTLVLSFGFGHISLRPAVGSELQLVCATADRPLRREDLHRVTFTAVERRSWLGRLHREHWSLLVPTGFDHLVIQSGGAMVESEGLDWGSVRLEGAMSRFHCSALHLGVVELVGAKLGARLTVERLDRVRLEGLNHQMQITHGEAFALNPTTRGLACRVEGEEAMPGALHHLEAHLEGINNALEVHHAAR